MLYSLHQMLQYYIAQLYCFLIFEPFRVDPITGAAAVLAPSPAGPKNAKNYIGQIPKFASRTECSTIV